MRQVWCSSAAPGIALCAASVTACCVAPVSTSCVALPPVIAAFVTEDPVWHHFAATHRTYSWSCRHVQHLWWGLVPDIIWKIRSPMPVCEFWGRGIVQIDRLSLYFSTPPPRLVCAQYNLTMSVRQIVGLYWPGGYYTGVQKNHGGGLSWARPRINLKGCTGEQTNKGVELYW